VTAGSSNSTPPLDVIAARRVEPAMLGHVRRPWPYSLAFITEFSPGCFLRRGADGRRTPLRLHARPYQVLCSTVCIGAIFRAGCTNGVGGGDLHELDTHRRRRRGSELSLGRGLHGGGPTIVDRPAADRVRRFVDTGTKRRTAAWRRAWCAPWLCGWMICCFWPDYLPKN
jgi:hypothetical protein